MKRKRAILLAFVAAGNFLATSAWADRGYYGPGPGRYPPVVHHHHHGYRGAWALGTGLLLGSAVLWAATRPPPVVVAPEPVVVAPPRVIVPQPATVWWYYCRPAGAYYPYVQSCPSGWEAVPAQPQ